MHDWSGPMQESAKAVLKLLQHTLQFMTLKGLDFWVPSWARPTRDCYKGEAMMDIELTLVDDPAWGLLKVVTVGIISWHVI